MTKPLRIMQLIAVIFLASASGLPVSASPSSSAIQTTGVPGVIRYDVVPASSVPRGGNEVQGLVVSLSAETPVVKLNQPLVLTVTIANRSSMVQLLFAPICPHNYLFSVTNLSTNSTSDVSPLECYESVTSSIVERLSPGMATLLTFEFDSPNVIGVPGRYTISVQSIISYDDDPFTRLPFLRIASNPVSVVIN
jgi:hypothetical protein